MKKITIVIHSVPDEVNPLDLIMELSEVYGEAFAESQTGNLDILDFEYIKEEKE